MRGLFWNTRFLIFKRCLMSRTTPKPAHSSPNFCITSAEGHSSPTDFKPTIQEHSTPELVINVETGQNWQEWEVSVGSLGLDGVSITPRHLDCRAVTVTGVSTCVCGT
ncbi:hypothetical protein AVEN_172224-1 [Araneus ventricosus]|uniref:Uncharacterized protein n=1 Tax=Araneus ventricosus TaxID=182803 RepID=A0A4Y2K002_ARAVE|nr:hypothetical protein AVEN_172224-1 [Araneus ventricosus]